MNPELDWRVVAYLLALAVEQAALESIRVLDEEERCVAPGRDLERWHGLGRRLRGCVPQATRHSRPIKSQAVSDVSSSRLLVSLRTSAR
jgi:hypothetical protein